MDDFYQHLSGNFDFQLHYLLEEIPGVARDSIRNGELQKLIMAVVSQLHAPTVLPLEKWPPVLNG
jgi:hypothetical protein